MTPPTARFQMVRELPSEGGTAASLVRDNRTGKLCVLKTASEPAAVRRLEAMAGVLRHHPLHGAPSFVELFPAEGGGGVCLVREHADGETLADRLGTGGSLTESEAARIAAAALVTLGELHSLHPPAVHGSLSPANILLTPGGGVLLLDPLGEGLSPAADLRALADALQAALPGTPSDDFARLLSRLSQAGEKPGFRSAAEARAAFAAWRGTPGSQHRDGRRTGKPLFTARNLLLAALVLLGSFWIGIKVRFEVLPERRARERVLGTAVAPKDPRCRAILAPRPALASNLLRDPGLENLCGWNATPRRPALLSWKDSCFTGQACARLSQAEDELFQDVDVSALSPWIRTGRAVVTFQAHMRTDGPRQTGNPYLWGYAMRSEQDWVYLGPTQPERSRAWMRRGGTWNLPPETRAIRIMLKKNNARGAFLSNNAYFDNISVFVNHSGPPPATP